MTNTKETKQNKRFRPVRILLYIIVLCIVIGLVKTFLIPPPKPNIAINYVEKLNQLTKPQNYNPADNAAPLYEQAFKEFKKMPEELKDIISQWVWSHRKMVWSGDLEQEELKQLEDWLRSNEKAFEYVALATEKPYWWRCLSSPDNSCLGIEFQYMSPAMRMVDALCWRAILSVLKDDVQSAIIDFRTSQKIADHLDRKPFLLDRIVARRMRHCVFGSIFTSLSRVDFDNTALSQLQADLEKLFASMPADPASFDFALITEKMSTKDYIQRYFTDDGKDDGYFLLDRWEEENMLFRPAASSFSDYSKTFDGIMNYLKDRLVDAKQKREIISKLESRKITVDKLDEFYEAIRDAGKYSPGQLHSQGTTYQGRVDAVVNISDNYFLNRMLRATTILPKILYNYQGRHKAIITTVAIMRYKNDNRGYPQSLDQLVEAGYLEALPIDPYSDSPLGYKLVDDDFILYSVDEDFDDDGGTKQYSRKDKDGDNIYWPIPKPEKIDTPMMMPGMPSMPGMGMPGMMPPPEQPPMDPNLIT